MAMRENIKRVAMMMNGNDMEVTEESPEYYGIASWMTDEQATVLGAMKLRQPTAPSFICDKIGMTEEECKRIMDELADIGMLVRANMRGQDIYITMVWVPGAFELLVVNKELTEAHPEIARAFDEYTLKHYEEYMPNAPIGGGIMKTIPVEAAISGDTKAVPFEEVSYYVERNKDHLCVTGCQCRRTRRMAGEGCGHLEEDMCIIMGPASDTMVKQNRARRINTAECYEILKRAEDDGLVHQITNMDGDGKCFAICNCCTCSCFALRTSQYYNTPNLSRSSYVAEITTENCVACGQCVQYCPANALKLGQKLCTVTPITYEHAPTPEDHEWGPEMYNPEYRTNMKDVVDTGTAPCKTACPAHIAVQGYIKLAAQGRYMEALELIKKDNPFPAVCGRICPHNCESECTRGDIDEPIAIDEVKKFIADQELKSSYRFVPRKIHHYGKKMAIIGGGPAGLSCAYYLAIDGYKVTVFDKNPVPGGMMTLGIPAFRLEKTVVNAEIEVLKDLGVEFKCGVEVGKDVTIQKLREEGYKAFYIAIGAQGARKLGVEGEDAKGVIYGVDFLRRVNLGLPTALGADTIVIGGGNVAIDVARSAVRLKHFAHPENVSMYCLEQEHEMAALPDEIEEARSEGIEINNGWGPKRVVVEDGKVVGMEFKKCLSVFDEDGRFAPKYDENDTKIVPCGKIIISIGQTIEWGGLIDGLDVKVGPGGRAIADDFTYETGEPDIFVGGDVMTGPKFAINAIAAGKQGAISMHRAAWEGQSQIIGRRHPDYKSLDKANLDMDEITRGFDNTPRQRINIRPGHKNMFVDTRVTFTEEQLKKETSRCLGCGATIIDQNRCIGCGICTTKCKFDAIHLTKKFESKTVLFEELDKFNEEGKAMRAKNIAIRKSSTAK